VVYFRRILWCISEKFRGVFQRNFVVYFRGISLCISEEFRAVFERNFRPRCNVWSKSGRTQLFLLTA
jgi:hypothetical protein